MGQVEKMFGEYGTKPCFPLPMNGLIDLNGRSVVFWLRLRLLGLWSREFNGQYPIHWEREARFGSISSKHFLYLPHTYISNKKNKTDLTRQNR
ncbi:MAG: hypothetical protein AAFR59_07300, partial [Bacteroidota bacterium]